MKQGFISNDVSEWIRRSDIIDLHIDSFIWNRIGGYDLRVHHQRGWGGRRFYGQVDFPRIREAGLTGAQWVITTNPFRTQKGREKAFRKNLTRLKELFQEHSNEFQVVGSVRDYRKARGQGKHGVFLSIQGGHCLDSRGENLTKEIVSDLVRVTLVHLLPSRLAWPSTPLWKLGSSHLTSEGVELIRTLNTKRIFVDLAHISEKGFFEAIKVHRKDLPLIVTHTGVQGVYAHWRNLSDAQLHGIADSGGVVGIMFQRSFLDPKWRQQTLERVVDHLEYIVNRVGEDFAAIGSDFDGAILPPSGLEHVGDYPKLIQAMFDRGWREERVAKICGLNFLRALQDLRGD